MKVTVAFLSKRNSIWGKKDFYIKNLFLKFTDNIFKIFIFFVIVLALGLFQKIVKIPKGILNLATNFRLTEEFNFGMKEMVAMNGIFNVKNYLVGAKHEEIKEEVNPTKEDNLRKIDALAEDKNDVSVFAGKNINFEITENGENLQRISMENIRILNYSRKRDIDYKKLVEGVVNLTKSSDKILIYNTHTSESYANSEEYQFEYSGVRRSRDANYNMLAVANEFKNNLSNKGFNVTHNTTPHDYGTYDSAYSRSRITVQEALSRNPGYGLSIDLHRDAIEDLDFAPSVNINGVDVAQCMFVIGVGYDDESNPYYEENLKLALKLQYIADEVYPGLFRPMIIRNSVYNQDLNKYSILIEVGASGNTFDEAFYATRCLTNLLNIMYKD